MKPAHCGFFLLCAILVQNKDDVGGLYGATFASAAAVPPTPAFAGVAKFN